MSEPYVGEIRMFGGNFAPIDWAFCDGAVLAIADYDVLFNLIGTTYGGNGTTTFALPDLRGRLPVHMGNLTGGSSYVLGAFGGEAQVPLTAQHLPVHAHTMNAITTGGTGAGTAPAGTLLSGGNAEMFSSAAPSSPLAPGAVGLTGTASATHGNVMPCQAVNFIISLVGIYPSQA